MELVAETSAGPLPLELRQVGGATVVALGGTGDTWNSTYTPVPLASFLADFAHLPEAEAEALSARVLSDWEESPESAPPKKRSSVGKAAPIIAPGLVLTLLLVVVFGAIVYFVVRAVLLSTAG